MVSRQPIAFIIHFFSTSCYDCYFVIDFQKNVSPKDFELMNFADQFSLKEVNQLSRLEYFTRVLSSEEE